MEGTNFQTFHQMKGFVNDQAKQALGIDSVQTLDMKWVTVGQNKRLVQGAVEETGLASFSVSSPGSLKSLKVSMEPQQSGTGTPAPDNVRPITGHTGVTVKRTGKNLVEGRISGKYIASDGTFVSGNYDMVYAPVLAGATYTATTDEVSGLVAGFYTGIPEESSVSYNNSRVTQESTTFVAPISGYVAFRTSGNYATPQLEPGSSATAYEAPQTPQTVAVTFPAEPGTVYLGSVDIVTGVLTVDRQYYRLPRVPSILLGEFGYIKLDSIDCYIIIPLGGNYTYNVRYPHILSNQLKYTPSAIWTGSGYVNAFNINAETQLHISISNDLLGVTDYTQETPTTAKEKLLAYFAEQYDAENYFDFILPCATATYQLTAQDIETLAGENNIWSDAGNVTVEYYDLEEVP